VCEIDTQVCEGESIQGKGEGTHKKTATESETKTAKNQRLLEKSTGKQQPVSSQDNDAQLGEKAQTVPPASGNAPMWSELVRGGRKRPPQTTIAAEKTTLLRKRVPKTSAVIIDHSTGDTTLTSLMQKITENVDLRALGVNVVTTMITKTGGILLELDAAEDADKLPNSIKGVIGELARVSRTQRRTPVLIVSIQGWVDEDAVKSNLT